METSRQRGTAGEAVAEAWGLRFRYPSGRMGLEDLDLRVEPGELVVLLGPNGAGKSTLLHLLCGDLEPTDGRIGLFGSAYGPRLPAHRRRLGFVGVDEAHFEPLSGLANATLLARAYGLDRALAASRVADLLRRLRLEEDAEVPAGHYSQGMRRKLLLVEALAHEPTLVLLDEPAQGLDLPARSALQTLLHARAEEGGAILLATHDLPLATALATRVIFMHRGREVGGGSPAQLLSQLGGRPRIHVRLASAPPSPPDLGHGFDPTWNDDHLVVAPRDGTAALPRLCAALEGAGCGILEIRVKEPGLDDVFRRLTGEELEA